MVLQMFHNHVCVSYFRCISLLFIEEKQIESKRKYKRCPDMCTLQSIWEPERWSKNRSSISKDHVTINESSSRSNVEFKTRQLQVMTWSIIIHTWWHEIIKLLQNSVYIQLKLSKAIQFSIYFTTEQQFRS